MAAHRRDFLKGVLQAGTLAVLSNQQLLGQLPATCTVRTDGISLNYDNCHFLADHPFEEMNEQGLDAWVDQFAGTQVNALFFSPNSQRSSVASQVRQTLWDGYQPDKDDNQPFFASVSDVRDPSSPDDSSPRQRCRQCIHHAWYLNHNGVDLYGRWLARCRKHNIQPWLSMRMNDAHYVDDPHHPSHDRFWLEHPEYRRDWKGDPYNGQCLDYGRPEVREYQLKYVRELVSRYDIDGFELDFMRNPYYFKPGHEAAGMSILTEFIAEVRHLLNLQQDQLGRSLQLSVRVPDRPEAAAGLGFDVPSWVRQSLINRLVVTPFLFSQDAVPIAQWRAMLDGSSVILEAGMMETLQAFEGGVMQAHTPETARGVAANMLAGGADRVCLFNFFDDSPYGTHGEIYRKSPAGQAYRRVLNELGSLDTISGKSRRHVVSYFDTRASHQTSKDALPCGLKPGQQKTLRIPTNSSLLSSQLARIRFAAKDTDQSTLSGLKVRVNGQECRWIGPITLPPLSVAPTHAFDIPAGAVRQGDNEILFDNASNSDCQLVWLELYVSAADGQWPAQNSVDLQHVTAS